MRPIFRRRSCASHRIRYNRTADVGGRTHRLSAGAHRTVVAAARRAPRSCRRHAAARDGARMASRTRLPSGPRPHFKRKMREVGLDEHLPQSAGAAPAQPPALRARMPALVVCLRAATPAAACASPARAARRAGYDRRVRDARPRRCDRVACRPTSSASPARAARSTACARLRLLRDGARREVHLVMTRAGDARTLELETDLQPGRRREARRRGARPSRISQRRSRAVRSARTACS